MDDECKRLFNRITFFSFITFSESKIYVLTMAKIENFLSEKGKPLVVYEFHIYNLERQTDTKLIFRCQNRDCIKVDI